MPNMVNNHLPIPSFIFHKSLVPAVCQSQADSRNTVEKLTCYKAIYATRTFCFV